MRGRHNGPLIAALLDSFEADPAATRRQLRELPALRDHPFIGDLFALIIFLCEDLLTVRAESSASSASSASKYGSQVFQDGSISPHGAADGALQPCVWRREEQCAHKTL